MYCQIKKVKDYSFFDQKKQHSKKLFFSIFLACSENAIRTYDFDYNDRWKIGYNVKQHIGVITFAKNEEIR